MPATAFALCLDRIANLESSMQGANINTASVINKNFSVDAGFGMLILMAIVFLLFTWYADKVLPSEYGVPQSPWFLFTASALCIPVLGVCWAFRTHGWCLPISAIAEYWKESCCTSCRRNRKRRDARTSNAPTMNSEGNS